MTRKYTVVLILITKAEIILHFISAACMNTYKTRSQVGYFLERKFRRFRWIKWCIQKIIQIFGYGSGNFISLIMHELLKGFPFLNDNKTNGTKFVLKMRCAKGMGLTERLRWMHFNFLLKVESWPANFQKNISLRVIRPY